MSSLRASRLPALAGSLLTLALSLSWVPSAPAASADPAASTRYKPRLDPTFTAGQAFGYHATATLQSTIRMTVLSPGPQDNPKAFTETVAQDTREGYVVEFAADGLARSVYPNGSLREVVFLVRNFRLIHNTGKSETPLEPGAILAARKLDDGRVAITVDGKPPAIETANTLNLLFQLGDARYTYDAMLGPAAPVSVGSNWPVNETALLGSGFVQSFPGAQHALGKLRLEAVRPLAAGPLSVVTGTFSLQGVQAPFRPPVESQPSMVNFDLQFTAPVTPGPGNQDFELNTLIRHEGRAGSVVDGIPESHMNIGIAAEQHFRFTYDPALKAAPALLSATAVPDPLPVEAAAAPAKKSPSLTQWPMMANSPLKPAANPDAQISKILGDALLAGPQTRGGKGTPAPNANPVAPLTSSPASAAVASKTALPVPSPVMPAAASGNATTAPSSGPISFSSGPTVEFSLGSSAAPTPLATTAPLAPAAPPQSPSPAAAAAITPPVANTGNISAAASTGNPTATASPPPPAARSAFSRARPVPQSDRVPPSN